MLRRKLERLKEELFYLETNRTRLLKELGTSRDSKRLAERAVYLCAEIALDITDLIISIKGLPKPSSYGDAIRKLGEYKLVPKDFARRFSYIAGLRNFLAHDYEVDTAPDLKRFLKTGISDLRRFIALMEKL